MFLRMVLLVLFFVVSLPNAKAAVCLDIFPSETNDDLLSKGLVFDNLPLLFPFLPLDGYLNNPETLVLGDSFHLPNQQEQEIFIDLIPANETSSRLYLSGSVAWTNAKINVGGNPEDLIIIISGALDITGGNTEINAIIYVYGEVRITGNVEINGAVAAEGEISTNPAVNINYDQNAIENADFNGLCDSTLPPPPIDYCETTFVNGATSFTSNGKIKYSNTPVIYNDRNGVLAANKLEGGNPILNCDGFGDCSASTIPTLPLDLGSFDDQSNNTNLTISSSLTLGSDDDGNSYNTNKFGNLTVNNGGNLTFSANFDIYYMNELKVLDGGGNNNGTATINLAPGDYYIRKLKSKNNTTINVIGDGAVRLFINEHSDFEGNTKGNIGGAPENFLIYGFDKFHIKNTTEFHGLVYAQNEMKLEGEAKLVGAASAATVELKGTTEIYYTCDALPAEQTLLGLYKFEQTDFSTQIDDTSGLNNHAEMLLYGNSVFEGKYCRGFESDGWNLDNQISDGFRSSLDINNDVGLQGTISFWFNSTIDWDQGQERVLFDASMGESISDKYFVFEIQQDGRLKFAFEDSDDDDFTIIEPSSTRTANTWYYLSVTWDYTNNSFVMYVDGVLQQQETRNTNGAMGELNPVVFGDNSSSYTQAGNSNIASPVSSRGNYDEVRIYSRVLTQTEIQTDMNDDNGCVSELISNYQMDEPSWNGTSGEVINELGTLHGTAFGGLNTYRDNPARVGNPGTCGYGDFDGIDDYIEIADDPALDLPDQLTVTAWIYPTKLPSELMTILSKDENYEFHVTPSGEINWWWETNELSTTSLNIDPNNPAWYHIAITYKDGEQIIYVNGQENIRSTHSGNLTVNDDPLQIGQDQGYAGRYFQGAIDEVKIYNGALSATEIDEIYNETHPCDSYIDHFEIDTLNGQGITCEADEIIIKACADTSCSIINATGGVVDLFIDGNFYKQVLVAGENGTKTTYPYLTEGDASLSLLQTYDCTNTLGSKPCIVDFKDSGFIISDIPTQISGKSSDEGFNSTILSIQAVEKDDVSGSGACIGTFPDNTEVAVNLSYTCAGGDCKDLLALSNNGNSYTLTEAATAQNLYFSTDSTANFSLKYPHAGKFIINAQKDVEVEDSDGNIVIKDFSDNSNAFVERPFAFKLDFSTDPNEANAFAVNAVGEPDATKSAFKKAGETFQLTATAVQWEDDQDSSPYDGIPDDFHTISGNATAENFSDEELAIVHELLLPEPAADVNSGLLATNLSNTFTNSVITNEYDYSEVGIIKLSVNLGDNDYLGGGDVLGEVTNVGRFTPAYFTQAVDSHGELNAYHYDEPLTCETNNWAYAGQMRLDSSSSTVSTIGAISYTDHLAPIITITAYNLHDSITNNYTQLKFMNLSASGISIPAPVADDETNRLYPTVLNEKIQINANMTLGDEPEISNDSGIVTYTLNADDYFIYEHNKHSKILPFPAKIPFLIEEVEDSDGIKLYDGSNTDIVITEKIRTEGVEVRFGRWLLENSYGPETSTLPVTMFTQHFDGTRFITNEKESCLVPKVGSKVTTGDIGDPGLNLWDYRLVDVGDPDSLFPASTEASFEDEDKTFVSGLYQWLLFSAPGAGKIGSLKVEYQVPPWLQHDWDNDDNFTGNPTAKLTFGLFRGNDRIIYQREIEKTN